MNTYEELRREHGWGLMASSEQVASIFGFSGKLTAFNRLVREGKDDLFTELRKIRITAGRKSLYPTKLIADLIERLNLGENK
ncbi:MAG: hypothetical protein HQL75_00590 [Magnetococcales bacterium]|nr:hypothetical protein [Magnetococcales bacterium]